MQENICNKKPIIGITMGDPAGIGPEIIVSALTSPLISQICHPIVIGDIGVMEKALSLKKSTLKIHEILSTSQCNVACESFKESFNDSLNKFLNDSFNKYINIINLSSLSLNTIKPGNPSKDSGQAMIDYINKAVDLAISGKISAMVTAPITKTALKMAGSPFHGHTELIAHRTGTTDYAMMLAGEKLKVVLVTIHIPLSEVSKRLTVDNIVKTILIAGKALKNNFGIKNPRIAVAGLNPHSGENGMFGDEEQRVIIPAVVKAKELLTTAEGPFPPDTIFYHASKGEYDCVICMYHDQGLIPFKLLHFSEGVNTTLGLPIIRTSVDHGTAYDIAWQNRADDSSLIQAIKMAVLQANILGK